ncbi:MAG: iron-sulfur cluster assembly scaffold protein [Pseudomonadota bacterium]
MADSDLIKLYSTRILELASSIPHLGRLDAPHASVKKRAKLCGSTVTVDLRLDQNGRIAEFAQDVKACALGQAAAAIFGAQAIGRSRGEVEAARDGLRAMLEGGASPGAPFEEFKVLVAARDFKNRHGSILLALEATLEAMDAAEIADMPAAE